MKTLTALTAAVVLIAGMSVASAASSMDKTNAMSPSATQHITGTGQFCIKGASGALNCEYASLSACQKVAKSGASCEAKPSTTGSGTKN